MTAIAINCIEDLGARVESIPSLEGRVFHIYSEAEIIERTKGMAFPCVGIVYDGLMAAPEVGATSRMGNSAELVASIMIFFRQDTRAKVDPKDTMVATLDEIRSKIMESRSPTGHFWKFQVEASVEGKQGLLTYVQRWATPVQLT